ncbi:MAG: (E)-4-hydroxy-3-methylbut-2-enyl-diphosphate synthase, partial [Mogibacterium sp.]|nr:(E)-4-hydroxy-3-methylbut-2-enyl-diphosphate synthase [Mogibacterium sp.]
MTRQVMCGGVAIGGGAPVSIQSMTNVDTRDEKALLYQIEELADAGCDIVRVAIPDEAACESFARVRKHTRVPLVADIHFNYRLAIGAIQAGADKIRINPGNIGSADNVRKVVEAARERQIPIRVGVNSGSLRKDVLKKYGGVTAQGLAESGIEMLRMIEDLGYEDLVLSIKSSNVRMTYDAHLLVSRMTDHPLHIGITESGIPAHGKLKSAVGIGALLLAGIGDTIRVSLTGDPVQEVLFGRQILEAAGLREK